MRSGGDSTLDTRCAEIKKDMPVTIETSGACYGTAKPQRKENDAAKPAEDYRWPVEQSFYMSTGQFQTFGMFVNSGEGITNQQILRLEIAGGSGTNSAPSTARFFAEIRDNNGPDEHCSDANAPEKYAGIKGWGAKAAWKKDCVEWFRDGRRPATAGLLREMRPENYQRRNIENLVPAFKAPGLVANGVYRDHVREHIKNPDSLVLVSVPEDYISSAKVGDEGFYPGVQGRLDFAGPEEITLAIFTPKHSKTTDADGMSTDDFIKAADEDAKKTGEVDFAALRKAAFMFFNGKPEEAKKELDKIPVDIIEEPRKGPGCLNEAQRELYTWLKEKLKPTDEQCRAKTPTMDLSADKTKCVNTPDSCGRQGKEYEFDGTCIDTIAACKARKPQSLPYDETSKKCGAPCTPPQKVNAKGKCAKPVSDEDEDDSDASGSAMPM